MGCRVSQDRDVQSLMLVLAPVAVMALIAVSWLAGGWRDAVIDSADAARARLAADTSQDDAAALAARVLLSTDGRAALLTRAVGASADGQIDDQADKQADKQAGALAGDRIAAVVALGDRLVTRHLTPGLVRQVILRERPDGGRLLRIVTHDPTCRRIDLVLDAVDLSEWTDMLERLTQAPASMARAGAEACA